MKEIIKKILYPNKFLGFILFNLSFILLIFVFVKGYDTTIIAYIYYVLSFYSLVFFCIWFYNIIIKIKSKVNKNKIYKTYKSDIHIRLKTSLYFSTLINTIYGIFKLITGIYYKSYWFITFAAYYLLLSLVRILLLRNVNKNKLGENLVSEYKKLKLCGIVLLFLDLVLSGIIILIIIEKQTFKYPGYLIYVIALYDFYLIISAFINVFKYRKNTSPIVSSSKCINLTVAMISIVSLEVAMLTQFGESNIESFNTIMISCTGFGVCVINSLMAIIMIVNARKKIEIYN